MASGQHQNPHGFFERPAGTRADQNYTIVTAVWDVLSAAAAKAAGASHLFISGAAINNVHGYPDRGVLDVIDIARTVGEITDAVGLPILVDAETGFGTLPRLTRLIKELYSAGARAVMIEDQDVTGQSKTEDQTPAIGDPGEMRDRIRLIRSIAPDMGIVARTDYLEGMKFSESIARLHTYIEAGADWAMPVFVPSIEDYRSVAKEFSNRLVLLLAPGPYPHGPLLPHFEHMREIKPNAILITGQYRNAYVNLKSIYGMSLQGKWTEMHAGRPDPKKLDEELGLRRLGMTL